MFLCDLLGKSGVLMELVHYDVVFVCVCDLLDLSHYDAVFFV